VIELTSGTSSGLDRGQLRQVLRKRIRDGVLLRLIGKWLHAGVMEGTRVTDPEAGTPQGGVVSPILSNVFLHEVLDEWFEREVRPRMRGKAYLVRFADDAVLVFQCREDAERVRAVLGRRFEKYGLTRQKTRLRFSGAPGIGQGARGALRSLHALLGAFASRRLGGPTQDCLGAALAGAWCDRAVVPLEPSSAGGQQWRMLSWKVRGHDAYWDHGNMRALRSFHRAVERVWRKWLARRGGRRPMPWDRFARLLRQYPLPRAVIVHRVA
jgi:hypothetical protein